MRILLVGQFSPRTYYGILNKLKHGFIRLGHVVECFDDRAVARAATLFGSRKVGIAPMNRKLLETCDWFAPDFILLGHCKTVWNRTLETIRQRLPSVCIAYRNVDWLVVEDNVNLIHQRTQSVDAIFSTTAGESLHPFGGKRARVCYMPNPVDSAIENGQAFAMTGQPYDVFYAVGGTYDGDPRPPFIRALKEQCPTVAFSVHGMGGVPHIFGAAHTEALLKATMGLNYSRDNNQYLYSSDRMAQYMGNGLLTFVDRATGFDQLFSDEEIVFYENIDDLAQKIRHFKNHDAERQRVANAGWQKIHGAWASERVAQYILEQSFQQPLGLAYHWPTEAY
jgi:hypothetical protein